MILNNANFRGYAMVKVETDSPLVIDSNSYFPNQIVLEFFKAVAMRCSKIHPVGRQIDPEKPVQCRLLDILRQLRRKLSVPDLLCFFVAKGTDHGSMISLCNTIVKRQYGPFFEYVI